MENQRLFLFVALSFVLLLLWQAWLEDYGPVPQPAEQQQQVASEAPAVAQDVPAAAGSDAEDAAVLADAELLRSAEKIVVQTDLYRAVIDTHGGDLRQVDLLQYPESDTPGAEPFRLFNDSLPNLFVLQSGLRASKGNEPTHHARYTSGQTSYNLPADQTSLVVPLRWNNGNGVEVIKRYIFQRGSYTVGLEYEVTNAGETDWIARQYRQLQRTATTPGGQSRFIYTYTGGVLYSPEDRYQKIKFEEMTESDLDRTVTAGWAAMLQHYFLGAVIPEPDSVERYYTKVLDNERYVIGAISQPETVPAGGSSLFRTRLFIGPKLQDEMKTVAPGLELTVDYGMLTVLAQPLFWLLKTLHRLLGNWGWAIVFVTLIIKLVFYKLSETSYRSMANMRKLAPRMQQLKERYADDRQKLNQAMMEMYKKEKINPLGGCLPILVQIPVFIALYWVLLESVELRQAPFMLWITDMSTPDPYYVLPLLMGVTMFIQQKLNPAPMDPIQARVMMILPVVFTIFFAFFPSGLVLYWVVNNTLSIAQQYVITKRIERGGK